MDLRNVQLGAQVVCRRKGQFVNVHSRLAEDEVIKRCHGNRQLIPLFCYFVSQASGATVRILGNFRFRQGVSFVAHLVTNFRVRVRGVVYFRYFGNDLDLPFVINIVRSNDPFRVGATRAYVATSAPGRVSDHGRNSFSSKQVFL